MGWRRGCGHAQCRQDQWTTGTSPIVPHAAARGPIFRSAMRVLQVRGGSPIAGTYISFDRIVSPIIVYLFRSLTH